MNINDIITNEIEFCEECDFSKNNLSQYIYQSVDETSIINLPHILSMYKDWLVTNNKIKIVNGNK